MEINSYKKSIHAYLVLTKALTEETQVEDILKGFVRGLNSIGYYSVTLGKIDKSSREWIPVFVSCQDEEVVNYIQKVRIKLPEGLPSQHGSVGWAYYTKEAYIIEDVLNHPDTKPWYDFYSLFGIESSTSIPILIEDEVEYVILIHDREKSILEEYKTLLNDIKETLSKYLTNLRMGLKVEKQKEFDTLLAKSYTLLEDNIHNCNDYMLNLLKLIEENTKVDIGIVLKLEENDELQNIGYFTKIEPDSYNRILNLVKSLVRESNDIYFYTCDIANLVIIPIEKIRQILVLCSVDKDYIEPSMKTIFDVLKKTIENNLEKIANKRIIDALIEALNLNSETISMFVVADKDLDKSKELIEQIKNRIIFDPITEIPKEAYFIDIVSEIISTEKNGIYAVAMVDPLDFGYINTAYGFDFGNKTLREIARRLKNTVYEGDFIGKTEADRFLIFMRNIPDENSAYLGLYRILKELSEEYDVEGRKIKLSFRGSIAFYPTDGKTVPELVDRARRALFSGKKEALSIATYNEEVINKSLEILNIRRDIDELLDRKKLWYYWQPIVDENIKIVGLEGLLRLTKNGKLVSPAEFIPILERTRLIEKVETRLIGETIGLNDELRRLKSDIFISVNISALTLKSKNLLEVIKKRDKISNLHLEITESHFLEIDDETLKRINELKESGIKFMIDDFGSGYSNFYYISKLDLDGVKIDRSLITELGVINSIGGNVKLEIRNKRLMQNIKILEAIVKLCHNLGLTVVAEGVENLEQFETLRSMGVRYFQGYLFYRPMPLEEITSILEEH